MMKKRGSLEISFGWLFALLVGAVIIFLAIFLSVKLINTEQTNVGAKTSKEIGVLLNPLEIGFESAKTSSFTLPVETRIRNKCEEADKFQIFGKQGIQLSQKSLNQWRETEVDVSFENKYIFSDDEIEGKTFHVFSKPFDFPFKVADLIYITSSLKEYCFVNPPGEIEEEISNLEQENLLLVEDECPEESITVCFDFGNCDINVHGDYVEKNGKRLYFENDALMYAGIFSSPKVYECQIERLMKRANQIALLYNEKGNIISERGCDFNFGEELISFGNSARSLISSSSLDEIKSQADSLDERNKFAACILW